LRIANFGLKRTTAMRLRFSFRNPQSTI